MRAPAPGAGVSDPRGAAGDRPGRVLVFVPAKDNGPVPLTDPGPGGTWQVRQPAPPASALPGPAAQAPAIPALAIPDLAIPDPAIPDPAIPDPAAPRGNGRDPGTDPVFVVCAGRSGSTLLRFLLDAHPDLACPPETKLPAMCTQMAAVWQQLAGTSPLAGPAIAGIRQALNLMIQPYLARRGKRRYCDKSLGAAEHVPVLREIFPGARFLCLYRHPMDVIASGIEACPWGLAGFGFDGYAAGSPGNAVKALAQFWADNAAQILAAEEQLGERAHRVRYEDLVADPEWVADGIFRFLGERPAPGISAACFAPERERLGPGDYKIWHTTRVSADSVGRGWAIPAEMMGPALMAGINELCARLGYAPIGQNWGIDPVPPDVRLPGTGPAVVQGDASTPPGAARAPAPAPAPAATAATGAHAAAPAGTGSTPPGLRMMAARLLSGLARVDDRFASAWRPCSAEVFLVTVTAPGGGSVAARWRVDLAAPGVTSASGLAPGETGGARWDIVGCADTWKQVLDGGINLSIAFRARQLRYCDTGDVAASVPGVRIAMLAELLGVTVWPPTEADDLAAFPLGTAAALW
jgi:sulfotransferase family protein